MTDHSHRPDEDGLLRGLIFKVLSEEITQPRPEYLPAHFNNAVTRLLALVNEQTRAAGDDSPIAWEATDADLNRDATITRDRGVAEIWQKAGMTVRPLYARNVQIRFTTEATPPKPAPDAKLAALLRNAALFLELGSRFAPNEAVTGRNAATGELLKTHGLADVMKSVAVECASFESAPAPPADGTLTANRVSDEELRSSLVNDMSCASYHGEDDAAPCAEGAACGCLATVRLLRKMIERPASGAGAAEPVDHSLGLPKSRFAKYKTSAELDAENATPPVRGDRETEVIEYIEMAQSRLRAAMMGDEPCKPCIDLAASYLQEAMSAISLPVQSTARPDREAFYTILKKYIPQESIDQAWQELKEAAGVQPGAGERGSARHNDSAFDSNCGIDSTCEHPYALETGENQ